MYEHISSPCPRSGCKYYNRLVFVQKDDEVVVEVVSHSPAIVVASNVAHQGDDVKKDNLDETEANPSPLEAPIKKSVHITRSVQRAPAAVACSPHPSHSFVPTYSQDGEKAQ